MKGKIWGSKFCLFSLVIFCVMVILIAFIWFQGALEENINQTNYEIMQETARQQLLNYETKIQEQLSQLQLYARSFENVDMNDYNAVKRQLNITEGVGSFETIFVANATGKLVSNHNALAGNIMKEQYFCNAMTGSDAIGAQYSVDEGGVTQLILAVPIYQDSAIVGILAGLEKQSQTDEPELTNSFGGLGATFIIDKEGNILLRSDNGSDTIGDAGNYLECINNENLSSIKDMPDRMDTYLTNDNAEVFRCEVNGRECIIIRELLAFNDWSLILQVDASFVNSQRTQIMNCVFRLMLLVLGSMLVIVVVMFWLRSYSGILKSKAELDLLTNLLNKKTFESKVDNILSNRPSDETGALLIIDLDNFKGINDRLGHMVGDRVLSCVANTMRETFRQQDYLGRIGGDEFAVYFTFHNNLDLNERSIVVQLRVKHFCRMVERISEEIGQNIKVSCSIGIAMNPEHGTSYEELYQSADKALYQAKKAGKAQYRILA